MQFHAATDKTQFSDVFQTPDKKADYYFVITSHPTLPDFIIVYLYVDDKLALSKKYQCFDSPNAFALCRNWAEWHDNQIQNHSRIISRRQLQ